MKNLLKNAFAVLLILSAAAVFAQTDSTGIFKLRNYSLHKGTVYFFLMMNDEVVEGKIVSSNETDILVDSDGKLLSLKKDEIRIVSNEDITDTDITSKPGKVKFKRMWIIGAGTVAPQGNAHFNASYNIKTAGDYQRGFSFFAGRIVPLSRYGAAKYEFDYTHLPNGDNNYTLENYYSSHETGGTINQFSFRAGLGVGTFDSNEGFMLDGFLSLCAGMHFKSSASFYEKKTNYLNVDTVYTTQALSEVMIGLDVNISLKVNLSKNFGVFAEPHFTVYSTANAPFQVVFKAGAFF